ncbi:UNVERIFIED_CONTAM: ribonuclease E [Bacteriophage sp.]
MALVFYGYGYPSEDAPKVDQYVDTSTGQLFYNMLRGDSENGFYREMVPTGKTWEYQNVADPSGKPIYGTQGYRPPESQSDEGGMSIKSETAGYTEAGYQLGDISNPNNPETKLANYAASKGYPPKYDPNYGWVIPSSAPVNAIRESYAAQFRGGGGFINQLLDAGLPLNLMMAAVTGGALGGASLGTTIGTELGLTGTAATTVGNAIVSGVQNLAATGDLNSAIVSAVASGAGGLTAQEAAAQLPAGTDPSLVRAVSGASGGAVGSAIRGQDIAQGALVGGISPVISDIITSGEDVTRPITPAPDQGGVPTPPPVQIPETPVETTAEVPAGRITDQEVIQQIQPKTDVTAPIEPVESTIDTEAVIPVGETPAVAPEAPATQEAVAPEVPVAPVDTTQELPSAVTTLPEVEVTAESETPTRDQQILDLTGLAPREQVSPIIDVAPTRTLPPSDQTLPEVEVTAEREIEPEDQQIISLTGLLPKQPVTTLPEVEVTADREIEPEQVDPFVDIAPPSDEGITEVFPAPEEDFEPYPEKKSDYTREISTLLNYLLSDRGRGGVGGRTYDLGGGGGGPGSQALAQALRVDAGAPIFGGEKKGKRSNVWNIESLRTKDETGA